MILLPNMTKTSQNLADNGNYENHTVLVVEDDDFLRETIVSALSQSKIDVLQAANGEDALQILQENPCELIVSDIKMPGMSGIELLDKVKSIRPSIHMIMITGFPTFDLSVSAMKAGAIDFLAKPFDMDDLLHKINIYLREKTLLSEESKTEKINTNKLKEQIAELSTRIYIYDKIETTKESNDYIFEEMAEFALKLVSGENSAILLYDAENDRFNPKVIRSSSFELYRHVILPSFNNLFREVIRKKEPLLHNTNDETPITNSLICVPLMVRNNAFGILTVSQKKNGTAFTEKDLSFIVTLTRRSSLNLENKILYESAYTNIMDTFHSLAASIQARDNYTQEHSIRVTELSVKIAQHLNFPPFEIESLKVSGMLHDIGKIAVPDKILLKKAALKEKEFAVMKNHPVIGKDILKPVLLFDHEIEAILHHHERWDGLGYPGKLSGYDIPLNARILTVADAYDAMTNNRPYRKAMSTTEAAKELQINCNQQFDKLIVDAFLKII